MFFTNASGRYQPYKTWKDTGTYAVAAGWSRPIPPDTTESLAPPGKPNPIKHWRKQLQPYDNTPRTNVAIPFNAPGSTVYLGSNDCGDNPNSIGYVLNIQNNNKEFKEGEYVVGPNGSRVCISCNPTSKQKIIRSALTEKLINPASTSEEPKRKYCHSSKQYLRQKCRTYDQRLSGAPVAGVDYTKNYNDNKEGPQTQRATTCEDNRCNSGDILIIKKPSNRQYSVQGAVDSSSRIQRLKMNTINKAANGLRNEWGSAAANAAKYTANGATPYFIKSKNNSFPKRTAIHKNGNKTICDC